MKKKGLLIMIFVLCAAGLAGCRFSVNISPGVSSFVYEDADRYTMGGTSLSDKVENVEVEWLSGNVQVAVHDRNTIEFSEEANKQLDRNNTLYYWLDGRTLHIKFCRSGKWNFAGLEKNLILWLPKDLKLKELKVDSISAAIAAGDVKAQKLELNSVSGAASVDGGEFDEIKGDFVSGDVSVASLNVPEEMEIDTVSGSVKLFLLQSADFTLEFETVSGDFSSDIALKADGDKYICGDGINRYEIDTVSGDVDIYANEDGF